MRAFLLTMVLLSGCGSTERAGQDAQSSSVTTNVTGTSGTTNSSSDGTHTGGSGGSQATGMEYFIRAELDGEALNATTEVSASWFPGLLQGWISVTGTDGSRTWNFMILNSESSEACDGGYITLDDLSQSINSDLASFWGAGTCTVKVTQAALNVGDVLEGTFAAALASPENLEAPVAVTGGHFRALREPDGTGP